MIEKQLTREEKDQLREIAIKENKSFSKVYMSVSAASKMLNHAVSGVPKEVMGFLQGFAQRDSNK